MRLEVTWPAHSVNSLTPGALLGACDALMSRTAFCGRLRSITGCPA